MSASGAAGGASGWEAGGAGCSGDAVTGATGGTFNPALGSAAWDGGNPGGGVGLPNPPLAQSTVLLAAIRPHTSSVVGGGGLSGVALDQADAGVEGRVSAPFQVED